MFCNQCGKELVENSNFCQNCGNNTKKTTQQPEIKAQLDTQSIKKETNIVVKVLKMVGAGILGMMILYYILGFLKVLLSAVE